MVGENLWRYTQIQHWEGRSLPHNQPAQPAGTVGMFNLREPKQLTGSEVLALILKVPPDRPFDEMVQLLKDRKHTLTLPAIEVIVEKEERRKKDSALLRKRLDWNLIFVEGEEGTILICTLPGGGGKWEMFIKTLEPSSFSRVPGAILFILGNADLLLT